jgi:orotidine-5'-phosphate decarboxylase
MKERIVVEASDYLCVALDTASLYGAVELAKNLSGRAGYLKVGLELFTAAGPPSVKELQALGFKVFLDLKLHDIPNTVGRAVRQAASLGVSLLTLHASGGPEMIAAAKEAADEAADSPGGRPRLLAVTVLTSLDDDILSHVFGLETPTGELVLHLATLAKGSGADGVVCSAREANLVKKMCGSDFLAVTPGIRPAGTASGDQKRITTPRDAIRAGADLLVVGRPITAAPDPAEAADKILGEIKGVLG